MFLLDKVLEIHSFSDSSKKVIQFDNELVDMTTSSSGHEGLIYILDITGEIWIDNVSHLSTGNLNMSRSIENLSDPTISSIFYSNNLQTLFLGHSNGKCSKLEVCSLNSNQTVVFKEIRNVHIDGTVSGELKHWNEEPEINLVTVGSSDLLVVENLTINEDM